MKIFNINRAGVVHRFKYGSSSDIGLPTIIFYLIGRKMLKETEAQGLEIKF